MHMSEKAVPCAAGVGIDAMDVIAPGKLWFENILQSRRHAMKPCRLFALPLIALLSAGALDPGPALAADGTRCVHAIDYDKLTANELDMLYRDVNVHEFANNAAIGGKCIAAIDYSKLSAAELDMLYRDTNVYPLAGSRVTGTKSVATTDFDKLSAAALAKLYRK